MRRLRDRRNLNDRPHYLALLLATTRRTYAAHSELPVGVGKQGRALRQRSAVFEHGTSAVLERKSCVVKYVKNVVAIAGSESAPWPQSCLGVDEVRQAMSTRRFIQVKL